MDIVIREKKSLLRVIFGIFNVGLALISIGYVEAYRELCQIMKQESYK